MAQQYIDTDLILHLNAGLTSSYDGSGTVWHDISGNGHDAQGYSGTGGGVVDDNFPQWQPVDGGRFYFDGSKGLNISTDMGTHSVGTHEMLVWRETNNATGYIADARNDDGVWWLTNYSDYNININNDLRINDPGYTTYQNNSALWGRWVHIVLMSDSNESECWIDGKKIDDERLKTTNVVNMNLGQNFRIGCRYTGSGRWVGYFKHYRIYNRKLTQSEIEYNYQGSLMKMPSRHIAFNDHQKYYDLISPKTQVINNNSEMAQGNYNKYAAYFNGDTSTFVRATFNDTSYFSLPLSFQCRVKKLSHTVSSYPIFWSFGRPYLSCDGSTDPFKFRFTNTSDTSVNVYSTTVPNLDQWYDITVLIDKTNVKLYVDGNLEADESVSPRITLCQNEDVELGRHNGNDSYRIHGLVEEWRIYHRLLTDTEIQEYSNSNLKGRITHEGEIQSRIVNEDYDWVLMDNFISDLDNGKTPYTEALGGTSINSEADLDDAGWDHYLTSIENSNYTRKKGYMQAFYSSSPEGYIEKTLPSDYEVVRVKWGNWYSGSARLYIGGSIRKTLSGDHGADEYVGTYSTGDKIKFWEGGIFWVGEIWVGKKKNNTRFLGQHGLTNEIINNYKPVNITDYSVWTAGTTGSQGNFNDNGAASENYLITSEDPWGQPATIWECRPDSSSGPDGGWNHDVDYIDNTKMYHYAVWVKRDSSTDGRFYHGCNGYGSTNGVYHRDDGTNNTNPYFYITSTAIPANQWVLVIGTIWPEGSGTGDNHELSGVWDLSGSKIDTLTRRDYVWRSETTSGRVRTYLYYSETTSQRQWMVYPMFWWSNNGEDSPSIQQLTSGFTQTGLGKLPTASTYQNSEHLYGPNSTKLRVKSNNKVITNGRVRIF